MHANRATADAVADQADDEHEPRVTGRFEILQVQDTT